MSLWLAGRNAAPPALEPGPVDASPAAIQATRFEDGDGRGRTLAEFSGKVVVVNFWATWCTPCREEMPGFVKLQSRWQDRGVQFVGLAQDDAAKVAAFGRELAINYPLWLGGAEVMEPFAAPGQPARGAAAHRAAGRPGAGASSRGSGSFRSRSSIPGLPRLRENELNFR